MFARIPVGGSLVIFMADSSMPCRLSCVIVYLTFVLLFQINCE